MREDWVLGYSFTVRRLDTINSKWRMNGANFRKEHFVALKWANFEQNAYSSLRTKPRR